MSGDNLTRRDFVTGTAKLAVGAMIAPPIIGAPMIVPRHVLGGPGYQAPSDTLNIACVGIRARRAASGLHGAAAATATPHDA